MIRSKVISNDPVWWTLIYVLTHSNKFIVTFLVADVIFDSGKGIV